MKRTCTAAICLSLVATTARGQWQAPSDLAPAPGGSHSRVWADLDGDLTLDLITPSPFGHPIAAVRVQRVIGGVLAPAVDYATSGDCGMITTADVDADGDVDVVLTTASPFGVDVLLNDGAGVLAPPIHVATLHNYYSSGIAAGDLDGDGRAEIVATLGLAFVNGNYLSANKLAVLRSLAVGVWSAPAYFDVGSGPQPVALADLDRDGDRDVVTGNSDSLSLCWNDGAASFAFITSLNTNSAVLDVTVRDVDHDAAPDILAALFDTVEVRRGLGGTSFAAPVLHATGIFNRALRCGDVNGDGNEDLVVSHWNQALAAFLPGAPGGAFGASSTFAAGSSGVLEIFDHDGDGRLDVVVAGQYVMHNGGAFQPVHAYCSATLMAAGCTPNVNYSGVPSVSASSGFVVRSLQSPSQVNGLFFFGINGALAAPFNGGTLCVASPRIRTTVQNSGGPPPAGSDCSGVFAIDFNAYVASGSGPAQLQVPGTVVHGQFWMRDVGGAPTATTALSDALRFELGP